MIDLAQLTVIAIALLMGTPAHAAPSDPYENIYQELRAYSREDCKEGGTPYVKRLRQAQSLNPHQRSEYTSTDTWECVAKEQEYADVYYTLLHNNTITLAALKACVVRMPRPGTAEHGGMLELSVCVQGSK